MSRNGSAKLLENVLSEEPIRFLCQTNPPTATAQTTLAGVVELLRDDSSGCVVVVDSETERSKPIGIFTERDFLDKIATLDRAARKAAEAEPIEKFMTPNPRFLAADDPSARAIKLMTQGGYRHLPIVDENGTLVGAVSARDLISYLAEFFPTEIYNLPPLMHQEQMFETREGG